MTKNPVSAIVVHIKSSRTCRLFPRSLPLYIIQIKWNNWHSQDIQTHSKKYSTAYLTASGQGKVFPSALGNLVYLTIMSRSIWYLHVVNSAKTVSNMCDYFSALPHFPPTTLRTEDEVCSTPGFHLHGHVEWQ